MGKTFKRNSEFRPKIRRSWGNTNPNERIEIPEKGDGSYRRRDKFGRNDWDRFGNDEE